MGRARIPSYHRSMTRYMAERLPQSQQQQQQNLNKGGPPQIGHVVLPGSWKTRGGHAECNAANGPEKSTAFQSSIEFTTTHRTKAPFRGISTTIIWILGILSLLVLSIRGFRPYFIPSEPAAATNDQVDRTGVLQDVVTWDEHSLFIHGERVMIMSGEFHPWRLPVPALWLDVFQKIKAMGFNCVSFYVNWALVEGEPGNFTADGVFSYEPFFEAASEAGVYLIARPGPYINAEVSFGGYPGWMQRVKGRLRTRDTDYLKATNNYIANIGAIIAKAQITNGGPVILYQPENEYTWGIPLRFPDGRYMQYVEDQARVAGITVPIISNDAFPLGHNAPGSGLGAVDIYGHDDYPLGFDCSEPTNWPIGSLRGFYHALHQTQSPTTPFTLVEFQGGAFDPWGGPGFESCASLLNAEFERVFYKNNLAAGVTIHNVYMVYGGTNWGNIGHPGGYTSYDYGAAIKEDRTITGEKYSELKLVSEWLKVSPGYLTAKPQLAGIFGYSSNPAVTVTRLTGNDTATNSSFYVIRHSDYTSKSSSNYTLHVRTSRGDVIIPALAETLTLNGRDSKIFVIDYDVRGNTLLYSTAEIFTHQKYQNRTVLVVYTGPNETNELAIKTSGPAEVVADESIMVSLNDTTIVLAWSTSDDRRIVKVDDIYIYILNRNQAHNYWVSDTSVSTPIIINGPYLVRNASIDGKVLSISADFNRSTAIEIIGAPLETTKILVNNDDTEFHIKNDSLLLTVTYEVPQIEIPDLRKLDWVGLNSLPEIGQSYDDSEWTLADHPTSNNSYQHQQTPTSLFASDYGYNAGVILFRGVFVAKGTEKSFRIKTQGGSAYGHSIWLNGTFLGSWIGNPRSSSSTNNYNIPSLIEGATYVFTVVIDHMGLDESFLVGRDFGKAPRGIIEYSLNSPWFRTTPIDWKLTGNFGGENYVDKARGPLNEGGLFAERQGYHQPKPPADAFESLSPFTAIAQPGIWFFGAPVVLDLPSDRYDIPLSFVIGGVAGGATRIQLYVNGWQFGKYVSNIGPQVSFPVPEGILNYRGENWVTLIIWTLEDEITQLSEFRLEAGVPVLAGRSPVRLVNSPSWTLRERAY